LNKKILVVIALDEESQIIINKLKLKKNSKNNRFYIGQYKDNIIYLVRTGIGKTSMAINLTRVLLEQDYDYIVNIGAAGATSNFLQCDKIIVSDAKYHDADLTTFGYKKGQIPGYPASYVTPRKTIEHFLSSIDELKQSSILTGDSFIESSIVKGNYLVDMESASFFQTLYSYNLKGLSFKIVSDIIDGSNVETYQMFEERKVGLYVFNFFIQILEAIK
jgi:adenosylhomocysteine nucleosidase